MARPLGILGRDGLSADLSAVALAEAEALAEEEALAKSGPRRPPMVCVKLPKRVLVVLHVL